MPRKKPRTVHMWMTWLKDYPIIDNQEKTIIKLLTDIPDKQYKLKRKALQFVDAYMKVRDQDI